MSETMTRLTEIFRELFEDDEITLSRETTAADIPAWDSLMHVTLMLTLERAFGLRFHSGDVSGLKNVGELEDLVARRQGAL